MSCIPGYLAEWDISPDNGATFLTLDSLVDGSINGNIDELECTTHASKGVRRFIPGHRDETADITMRWDEDDPAQVLMLDSVYPAPTSFKTIFLLERKINRRVFRGDAFLTSHSPNANLDDTAGLDTSLRLSGTTLEVQTS